MTDIGHCSQQIFSRAALVERFGVTHEEIGPYIMLAMECKASPAGGIDVEIGISVLTQTLCLGLDLAAAGVVRAYKPFMRAALLHLASDPARWSFQVDDDTAPRSLLFGQDDHAELRRLRLQELLGSHERPTHRYLVRRPGEAWSGCDNVGAQIAAGAEPMIFTLDAVSVADRFSSFFSGPFFIWKQTASMI